MNGFGISFPLFMIGISLIAIGSILDWNICRQLVGSVQFDSCAESNSDNPTHQTAAISIGIGIVLIVSAMLIFYFTGKPMTQDDSARSEGS